MKPTRPILRYFGGKWRLAPRLISLMPPHRTYVEPFGGAASVLLRKPRAEREVYNDLDKSVVNYVATVRNLPLGLSEEIRGTPYDRTEYYMTLQNDEPLVPFVDAYFAKKMSVRSFMSFGSDALTRRSAGFSDHPHRKAAWLTLPDAIVAAGERLKGVIIENVTALDIIAKHDSPDTFFYCDPPYPKSSRSSHHGYSTEMTDADHEALAAALHRIRGKAMVSGYDCPLYARLYDDWRKVEIPALKDNARRAVECAWMNY